MIFFFYVVIIEWSGACLQLIAHEGFNSGFITESCTSKCFFQRQKHVIITGDYFRAMQRILQCFQMHFLQYFENHVGWRETGNGMKKKTHIGLEIHVFSDGFVFCITAGNSRQHIFLQECPEWRDSFSLLYLFEGVRFIFNFNSSFLKISMPVKHLVFFSHVSRICASSLTMFPAGLQP